MCGMTPLYVCTRSCVWVKWLIHMCDMTHSYVRHDLFMCVTSPCLLSVTWLLYICRLIHMCDMTHSYVWHDPFTCVTGHIHMCDMTPLYLLTDSYVWPDSLICNRVKHECPDPFMSVLKKSRTKFMSVLKKSRTSSWLLQETWVSWPM